MTRTLLCRYQALSCARRFPAVYYPEIPIGMYPSIPQVPPYECHKNPDLVSRPSQGAREEGQTHGLAAPGEVLQRPAAELLVLFVLGPRVYGPLDGDSLYVNEPGFPHQVGDARDSVERKAGGTGSLMHTLVPPHQGRVVRESVVVASYYEVDVVDLQEAIRLEESDVLS